MPKKLLAYVETITGHRDTALLDKSVIASLRELLGTSDIWLYDIVHAQAQSLAALTTWSDQQGVHYRHDHLHGSDYTPLESCPQLAGKVSASGMLSQVRGTELSDPLQQLLPIVVEHKLIACCVIRYSSKPTAHQTDLAHGILSLYRNYLGLLEDSQIDTLTGLQNRKTFERSLSRLLEKKGQQMGTLGRSALPAERRRPADKENWLVIIDVDHFKRINDQFGHLYGDEILVLLARMMQKSFRQNDQLFRFGGEEFVALLRSVSYDATYKALERFRQKVAQHSFPKLGKITISAGFARIDACDLANAVLGYADEALYYAKDHGRNQIHCYESLLECGALAKKAL
ncbi:MAG: GGDEF domain-containing protein [Pseudomonadota bacterium]